MGHRALLPDFSSILVIYGFSLHLSHFSNNRSGGWGASNKHCALKMLPHRGTPGLNPPLRAKQCKNQGKSQNLRENSKYGGKTQNTAEKEKNTREKSKFWGKMQNTPEK